MRYPDIVEAQDALDKLAARFRSKKEKTRPEAPPHAGSGQMPGDDAELLRRASSSTKGAKFNRVWTGDDSDYDGDTSKGDLALCSMLAFWVGGYDPTRVDELFRRSGRMRPKWDAKHRADGATYGQMTLEEAFHNRTEYYSPPGPRATFGEQAPMPEPHRRGPRPQFRSAGELIHNCPSLRPPILHGLLRAGETMNIIAPPKTGKSWLVLDAAFAVAAGRPWLGRAVEAGEVLIIDNELHGETMANRIPKVAEARGIAFADYHDRLHVDNLRGRLAPLADMSSYFDDLEPGRFKLIILDAWYRFQAVGTDENDNGAMTEMYNLLDRFADRLGCAFVCIHHSTKGNQSGKSITDVGAGAGAQSRAADAHMIIRQHAEEGCFVIEAVARSWAPPEPVCVRWSWPVFSIENGLDAASLLGAKAATGAKASAEEKSAKFRMNMANENETILKGIESVQTKGEPGATKNELKIYAEMDTAKVNAALERMTEDGTLEGFDYFKKSAGREVTAYRRKVPVVQPTVFDSPEGCGGAEKPTSSAPPHPSAGLSDGGAVGGAEECPPCKGGPPHSTTPPEPRTPKGSKTLKKKPKRKKHETAAQGPSRSRGGGSPTGENSV